MNPITREEATGQVQLVPEPPFDSPLGLARHIATIGIAGLLTGVAVGGIGGRLFMRIAGAVASEAQGRTTEAGFTVGEVTFGDSLGLVIFVGIFTGLAGAVLFAVFYPWLSWAKRWRGLVFGLLLFAVASATSDIMNPDNFDFFILGNEPFLVVMILALFVAFGLVADVSLRFLGARFPVSERLRDGANPVYVLLSIVGLLFLLAAIPAFATDSFCDCDPPIGVSWSIGVAAMGTMIWWAIALFSALPMWSKRIAAVFGYTGLAGAFSFGLVRAVSDAIEIIG